MYWKLFRSPLSVFNSAALAFLCKYVKCGRLQPTQRNKIPTFKAVLVLAVGNGTLDFHFVAQVNLLDKNFSFKSLPFLWCSASEGSL